MNLTVRLALLAALAWPAASPAQAAQDPPVTIDTHVDIPFNYMAEPRFDVGKDTRLLVDLGKMERGGLNAVFFVVWVPQHALDAAGYAKAVQQASQKYDGIGRMLMMYPDRIRLATTPEQLVANHKAGLLSATIEIENAYSLGHDLRRLDAAFDRGARSVGLVHVGNNDLCTSSLPDTEHSEPAMNSAGDQGMSAFGRAVVKRANQLGMLVDISHASDKCVRDALQASAAPIIATHSGARAVLDHPRNLPDELLRAIAAKGGVVQAVAYKEFLKHDPGREAAEKKLQEAVAKQAGEKAYDSDNDDYRPEMEAGMAEIQKTYPLATLDDYVKQIRHMVKVAGIDHVGLASDFDGGGGITSWKDASETRNVTAALRKAGFSDADIAKLWGGNLLRVWGEVERHAQH
ncbi:MULTISPECIES: dipeptidase [Rhodanobacter]|uniref:dipeptidase n=1 Tax=Rhodanobacter TaxID=75309 RepID=UPI00040897D6|nr:MULTISPECIES: dipeptidase [Rhodanobacter]TAN16323.1 MAG: membrane dipeptidase [Rhodanobacter sp.]UJJ54629.1 dipeptidase [Rhodanobacter thiooxydans]